MHQLHEWALPLRAVHISRWARWAWQSVQSKQLRLDVWRWPERFVGHYRHVRVKMFAGCIG